jgi:hypothetical protein
LHCRPADQVVGEIVLHCPRRDSELPSVEEGS